MIKILTVLVLINLVNMWTLFFLSLESCLMIRFDLFYHLKFRRTSISYKIVNKKNRLRTYIICMLLLVIPNWLIIWDKYGFGIDKPSSRLCSMKRTNFDEHKLIYYWATIFCTFGILLLGLYTMCFIGSSTFKNYHLKLKISGFKLLAKLICLPMIFMLVNFAFFYRLLHISECAPVINYATYIAGHLMGAMLAIGVWGTNSFVRRRLNKNTFRTSCYYFKCGCFRSDRSNSSSNCTIPAEDKSCAPPRKSRW